MNAKLDLMTPLWTADATKEARHVEGTGLIGSLRWWYEALVRGLGGWTCDPSDDHSRCPPGGATVTPETVPRVLCPACQVFGATGWAKTFHLVVHDETQPGYPPAGRGRVWADRLNAQGKQSAYYYPPGRAGTIMLTILPRRPDHAETVPLLLGLLEFVRGNAGLGAKTNLGYGLFEWQAPAPEGLPDAVTFAAGIARRAGVGRRGNSERWPDLSEMFFAEVRLERPWQPMHFANFKYDLREALRDGPTIERLLPNAGQRRQLRHFLLGTVKSDPNQASKIKMALLPEQRTLRVWGWVPERLPAGAPREPVLSIVHAQVGQSGAITRWREFHSSRDTIGLFTDPEAYLRSLMEG